MKIFICLLALSFNSAFAANNIEVVFNTPGFRDQPATTVEDKVIQLISLAEPGSQIRLSMYSFARMSIGTELLKASARGVDVQIVLDGANKSAAKKKGTVIYALLNGDSSLPALKCSAQSCVHFCGGFLNINSSCRGTLNNHNKFLLFSKLSDGRQNAVALSSANWTTSQLHQANDITVFSNDAGLYAGVLGYWVALHSKKSDTPLTIKGSETEIYTFPNQMSDPVLDNLNRVTCQLPGSKIRVMQSRLTDDRLAISKKLVSLSQAGCDVKVVARHEPSMKSPGPKIVSTLKDLLILLPYEGKKPADQSKNSNHAKIVLIDASVDGSSTRIPVVLAGSHNLNGSSLKKNDELLSRTANQSLLNSYLTFFDRVLADAGLSAN